MLSLRLSISSNGAVKLQIAYSCIKIKLFSGFFEADASLQTKHNEQSDRKNQSLHNNQLQGSCQTYVGSTGQKYKRIKKNSGCYLILNPEKEAKSYPIP